MVVHLCVYNPETDTFNRIFINFDPDKTYKQTCYIDNNNCLWAVNPYPSDATTPETCN